MRIQAYKQYNRSAIIEPTRVKFVIPAFSLPSATWNTASDLLAEFPFGNTDYLFSLKLNIEQFGSAFLAAVRWVEDDIVYRYKLWDDDDAVLFFPVYAGQKIGLNAVLEIWSLNTTDEPTLEDSEILYSSVLSFPEIGNACVGLCVEPDQSIDLVQQDPSSLPPSAYCNPFCNNLCSN